ncbi:metalloprotease [Algicella marina]|uniref:Metalloprotease n=1 Tax=Algicella marina TaxID=2683284 RepID=A0A6P1T5E0_9RHOB|nr:site-2 protease family protein [Algicella marina]QHQ36965.1 metalloprotease [Algicella marina]
MTLAWVLLAGVTALTWAVLRGGWRQRLAQMDMRPEGNALFTGILAVGAAIWFFGIEGGLALSLTIAIHEYGHVAAFRVAGHPDATFRLIPLIGGVAISRKSPASDLHDLYITIMGPGICLGLMAAAWMLLQTELAYIPHVGQFLYYLAAFTGGLNFFNLLPIYPLDGGKIFWLIFGRYAPAIARYVLFAMTGVILLLAILRFSLFIFILALFSFQALRQIGHGRHRMRPMSHGQALMATGAWLAMLVSFALGGLSFLLAQA